MKLASVFLTFLQLIGIGAAVIFAMLLVVRLGTPARSKIAAGPTPRE